MTTKILQYKVISKGNIRKREYLFTCKRVFIVSSGYNETSTANPATAPDNRDFKKENSVSPVNGTAFSTSIVVISLVREK
jgi:hypothetical protein